MAAPFRLMKRVRAKTVRKAAVAADTAAVAAVAVAIAAAAEAVAVVVVVIAAAAVVAADTATAAATVAATKPEHAINSQKGVRKGALFVVPSKVDRAVPARLSANGYRAGTARSTSDTWTLCPMFMFRLRPDAPGGTSTPSLSYPLTSHRVLLGAQFDILPKVEL